MKKKALKNATPEQVREEWARRLESGKFKQGKRMLKFEKKKGDVRYCCLGVLCDMAVEAGIITTAEGEDQDGIPIWKFSGDEPVGSQSTSLTLNFTTLPIKVQKWSGLNDSVGTLKEPILNSTNLTDLNDSDLLKFPGIARLIVGGGVQVRNDTAV